MRASVVLSALVAVLVGFAGSVAVILAAADAVGADARQTESWIGVLCIAMCVTSAMLSVRYRMPIVTAWSTPGAALIATTSGISMHAAVGAFILAALLILATALIRPLGSLVARIPTAIASAMLAGVLFAFVVALVPQASGLPALVLPLIAGFVILRLISPFGAVLIVLAVGMALSHLLGLAGPLPALSVTQFAVIAPIFDPQTLIGLALPLYLVTMASQNLPGLAVLRGDGYDPPVSAALGVTGLASLASAPFGGHTSNLAAITASICTGPDAHPDPEQRWLCGPFYAAGYAGLALIGGWVVAVFASYPDALIITVAGLALIGPLVASLSASLANDADRFAAIATFVVAASGISAWGIGAAFWGLVAGLLVHACETAFRHLRQDG